MRKQLIHNNSLYFNTLRLSRFLARIFYPTNERRLRGNSDIPFRTLLTLVLDLCPSKDLLLQSQVFLASFCLGPSAYLLAQVQVSLARLSTSWLAFERRNPLKKAPSSVARASLPLLPLLLLGPSPEPSFPSPSIDPVRTRTQ